MHARELEVRQLQLLAQLLRRAHLLPELVDQRGRGRRRLRLLLVVLAALLLVLVLALLRRLAGVAGVAVAERLVVQRVRLDGPQHVQHGGLVVVRELGLEDHQQLPQLAEGRRELRRHQDAAQLLAPLVVLGRVLELLEVRAHVLLLLLELVLGDHLLLLRRLLGLGGLLAPALLRGDGVRLGLGGLLGHALLLLLPHDAGVEGRVRGEVAQHDRHARLRLLLRLAPVDPGPDRLLRVRLPVHVDGPRGHVGVRLARLLRGGRGAGRGRRLLRGRGAPRRRRPKPPPRTSRVL